MCQAHSVTSLGALFKYHLFSESFADADLKLRPPPTSTSFSFFLPCFFSRANHHLARPVLYLLSLSATSPLQAT